MSQNEDDVVVLREKLKKERMVTVKITDSQAFWTLFDQMIQAECGFVHNRNCLLEAFVEGRLHTVGVVETAEWFEDGETRYRLTTWFGQPIFGPSPGYTCLPAFIVVTDTTVCHMMWVRKDMRRLGIGSLLTKDMKIESTTRQLAGSEPFWDHCGLREAKRTRNE